MLPKVASSSTRIVGRSPISLTRLSAERLQTTMGWTRLAFPRQNQVDADYYRRRANPKAQLEPGSHRSDDRRHVGTVRCLVVGVCGRRLRPDSVLGPDLHWWHRSLGNRLVPHAFLRRGGCSRHRSGSTRRAEIEAIRKTETSPGILLASGYIAGGSLAGVAVAFLNFTPKFQKSIDISDSTTATLATAPILGNLNPADLVAIGLFAVLIVFAILVGTGKLLAPRPENANGNNNVS